MSGGPWPAPAKINLFLHVLGRRADGYHELQTVFQFLDLCDEIAIQVRGDGRLLRLSALDGVAAEDDLVIRSARALQAATGSPLGAEFRVSKRIPLGGGLGGGSSDAATVLVALNRLWNTGLDADALADLGLGLGADVPVFVHGRAAWAEGVGERLVPVEPPEPWYLVVHPGIAVPTAEVFGAPELTRNTPPIRIRDFLAGQGHNDCELVVRRRHPQVAAMLDWLALHGPARMTGTGACAFLPCAGEQQARALCAELPRPWRGWAARGRNRSPLLCRLDAAARSTAVRG